MDAMGRGLSEAVRPIAESAARDEGVELVDLEFRREPVGWVLRLFIDRTGGVSLEDCRRVSEVVGTLLEVEDPIHHPYTLEVSSPGLTRPLRTSEDWRRSVGTLVKIVTRRPVAGSQSLTGRLLEANEGALKLDVNGTHVEVDPGLVVRARREVEWSAGGGRRGRGSQRRKQG